jgi:diguanylate cyclase (GGDEF)-like protein
VVESTTFRFEKKVMPTTISLGVATWLGGEDTADALYNRADNALYAAKQGGRNRVVQS